MNGTESANAALNQIRLSLDGGDSFHGDIIEKTKEALGQSLGELEF